MRYCHVLNNVGNTPMIEITDRELKDIRLFGKLEYYNPTGSVKDRAANYIIKKLFNNKEIDNNTTIVESSSGNFGVSLSAYCKKYNLKFICVVDPHINPVNEMLIKSFGAEIIKVTECDNSGGYLLSRIKKVNELVEKTKNIYWINQYENPYNAEAYYMSLGNEICNEVENIDYIFIGVSSGGTITGVSNKVKERYPHAKVIAVDIIGSVIFGYPSGKRYIPGIGSSMVPGILDHAKIDDVVMIDELATIANCNELLNKYFLFLGGSSGSVFAAVKQYFKDKHFNKKQNVIVIFADKGYGYHETIYNNNWQVNFKEKSMAMSLV